MNPPDVIETRPPKRVADTIHPAGYLARARVAASTMFLMDGMAFGTWAALIPSFQQKFALSTGQLSWVLVGMVIAAMISMPLAGRLVAAVGSWPVLYTVGLVFPSSLLGLMVAPNYGCLIAAGTFFGACKGMVDVSISAQGVAVEDALGKPILASLNGFWSSGGLVSAAALSFALHHGATVPHLMGGMVVLLVLMTLSTTGRMLAEKRSATALERPRRFAWPETRLLQLGALAFLGLFSEGVLLDWSAVYAHKVAHVSLATAPVAFAAFSICMAGGRFAGDFLLARWGAVKALRVSAAFMGVGMGVATLVQNWPATLAGFMTVGFGIANLVPIVFGAAARAHADGAGPGIATVSTIGYTGFLCGPPVVGLLASFAGLPVALSIVVVFGCIIATAGVAVVRRAAGG